jgi:hypothetical protein
MLAVPRKDDRVDVPDCLDSLFYRRLTQRPAFDMPYPTLCEGILSMIIRLKCYQRIRSWSICTWDFSKSVLHLSISENH